MKWVLLWFIHSPFDYRVNVAGSESFTTKETCEQAAKALYEIAKLESNLVLHKCVKK
jgi:hypothetical protein